MAASRSRRRKPKSGTARLSREMLLPLPLAHARWLSLKAHMDLSNLRSGHGSFDLASDLLLTVYISYLISIKDGRHDAQPDFLSAEISLRALTDNVEYGGEWRLEADMCQAVERVLAIHDRQLASVPQHVYEGARASLLKLVNHQMLPTILEIDRITGADRGERRLR